MLLHFYLIYKLFTDHAVFLRLVFEITSTGRIHSEPSDKLGSANRKGGKRSAGSAGGSMLSETNKK
jgi:hypothetical protein